MTNKTDFTMLLCGTSMAYPKTGNIRQLVNNWFDPIVGYINTLPQNDDNKQTIETLEKLLMGTYL